MDKFEIPKNLEIRFVNDEIGYGVFTTKKIMKDETIEISYCMEYDGFIGQFQDYKYNHPFTHKNLMPFGYGCIYNHSNDYNVLWLPIEGSNNIIRFFASRDIEPEEELTHHYGEIYWKHVNKKII
jgi:SET domain-containing protein